MNESHDNPVLKMESVCKSYEAGIPVLDSCNLVVSAGESVSIVGPSGSGKSTLLHLAAGLDRPDSGCVYMEGVDIGTMDDRELAGMRNHKTGFVFQDHYLLSHCTVAENVMLPAAAGRKIHIGVKSDAERLLRRVGLLERADDFPANLSGGQRQRVAVIRSLLNHPRLVFADEPTGSLDRRTAGEVVDLLVNLTTEENVAIVMVTHDQQTASKCSRQLELSSGRLVPAEGEAS